MKKKKFYSFFTLIIYVKSNLQSRSILKKLSEGELFSRYSHIKKNSFHNFFKYYSSFSKNSENFNRIVVLPSANLSMAKNYTVEKKSDFFERKYFEKFDVKINISKERKVEIKKSQI